MPYFMPAVSVMATFHVSCLLKLLGVQACRKSVSHPSMQYAQLRLPYAAALAAMHTKPPMLQEH